MMGMAGPARSGLGKGIEDLASPQRTHSWGYLLTGQRAGVALQLQHVAMGTRSIQSGWGGRFIWKENEWESDWTKTCLDEAGPIGIKVTASIPQVPLSAMFRSRHSPSTLTWSTAAGNPLTCTPCHSGLTQAPKWHGSECRWSRSVFVRKSD